MVLNAVKSLAGQSCGRQTMLSCLLEMLMTATMQFSGEKSTIPQTSQSHIQNKYDLFLFFFFFHLFSFFIDLMKMTVHIGDS